MNGGEERRPPPRDQAKTLPDNGPVIDTGPSSVEVERGDADDDDTPRPAVQPEIVPPPD
ncbi:hypothetical protein GRI40_05520 [Altererythrobacter aerius]|uniref:Uncharacterized protein n=1 Tax=Tsuneonella aeria TaxID=1837929 RepID=A0A6I4TB01_9SPHN|nr:hypothetical protein [Tsuneonella aeria]MXO74679.1 hypothetical protein [Tsuneonella aeria]